MKRLHGLLGAAALALVLAFGVPATVPQVTSSTYAVDCLWNNNHGPAISGGGGSVGAQAGISSGYWALFPALCGGGVAVDLSIDYEGGRSVSGSYNAFASHYPGGTHYGPHTARAVFFIQGFLVDVRTHTTYLPWPGECENPEGSGNWGQWDSDLGQCVSPIIIHLKRGEVRELTTAARGVLFDIDADGDLDQVAWTRANRRNQAFLVLDRNGNGTIDDGRELFGNFTTDDALNGFDALDKVVDANDDGAADSRDPLFANLQLWTDLNHDGISQREELRPAGDVLESIGLGADLDTKVDRNGNRFRWRGGATFKGNGRRADRELPIYDVYLQVQ